MNNQNQKEQLQKRIDALPEEIRRFLYSTEEEVLMQQMGVKHRLHLDQVGMLMATTNEVLTGDMSTANYPQALAENLNIDLSTANTVASDMSEQLFNRIRDAMKKVYELNKTPAKVVGEGVAPAPTMPTPVPMAKVETKPEIPPPPKGALGSMPAIDASAPTTSALNRPELTKADTILSQPTVSKPIATPAQTPTTPKTYTQDPYREPPTP